MNSNDVYKQMEARATVMADNELVPMMSACLMALADRRLVGAVEALVVLSELSILASIVYEHQAQQIIGGHNVN